MGTGSLGEFQGGRLFFALSPPDPVRDQMVSRSRTLLEKQSASARIVSAENLHLTLLFLGDRLTAQDEAVVRTAAAAVRWRAFAMTLDISGSFAARNRTGWLGMQCPPDPLLALQRELATRIPTREPQAREFVPHVTLVRNASSSFPIGAIPPIEWPVQEIVLIRSVPDAMRYEAVKRFPAR